MNIRLSAIVAVLLLSGCSTTPLVGVGANVKEIDKDKAKSCHFVQSFIVKTENPLAKNAEDDIRHIAMNRTDVLGGNAFLVENEDFIPSSLTIGTVIELRANAYKCPPEK